MKKWCSIRVVAAGAALALAVMACGLASPPAAANAPMPPIQVGDDLTQVDLCKAIPQEDIEAVMGRKLASPPKSFDYFGTRDTSGCTYDAGKDSNGEAHFGYVVLTPVEVYNTQPLYQNVAVSGLGQEAYFNNGADARQLWVKMNERVAFVVAFGDVPNEAGARTIAQLVAAAIK